jgi:hypothetical protein
MSGGPSTFFLLLTHMAYMAAHRPELSVNPNAQQYGETPALGNSAYRSKLVVRYTDCNRNTTRTTRKDTHPVPGSPRSEPAGALATARPNSHPGLWDTNGMGVAGVPRCCLPVSSMGLD